MERAMPTDHLRLLTERTAPVPPALLAKAGAWARAADEAAVSLTDALAASVEAGVPRITLTDDAACAASEAGVLCPLTDGRGHFQVAASDALRLAALLLRSEEVPEAPVLLDTLLIRCVASAVLSPVSAAFGTTLTLAGGAPLLDWPLTDAPSPVLHIELPFTLGGKEIRIGLLLTAPHGDFEAPRARPPAPSPALRRAALAAPARVEAVLDSWSVSPGTAAALAVGTVLPLPGASVEALELRVRTTGGSHVVGQGELGRARGRQAVRVTGGA